MDIVSPAKNAHENSKYSLSSHMINTVCLQPGSQTVWLDIKFMGHPFFLEDPISKDDSTIWRIWRNLKPPWSLPLVRDDTLFTHWEVLASSSEFNNSCRMWHTHDLFSVNLPQHKICPLTMYASIYFYVSRIFLNIIFKYLFCPFVLFSCLKIPMINMLEPLSLFSTAVIFFLVPLKLMIMVSFLLIFSFVLFPSPFFVFPKTSYFLLGPSNPTFASVVVLPADAILPSANLALSPAVSLGYTGWASLIPKSRILQTLELFEHWQVENSILDLRWWAAQNY